MNPGTKRLLFSSLLSLPVALIMLYYSYVPELLYFSYSVHPYRFLAYTASIALLFSFFELYLLRRYLGYLYLTSPFRLYFAFLTFLIFVAGTYLQSELLQMAGAVLTFLAVVGYFGGRGAMLFASPSLSFILLALSYLTGLELPLTILLFLASGLIGYVSLRVKKVEMKDCEFCPQYRKEGRNFCLYCGKLLNHIPFLFPSKRALVLLLAMLVLLGSFQVSIFAYEQENGYPVLKMLNLANTKTLAPIPSLPGISISNPKVENLATGNVYIYNMTYGNILTQKAYLSLASTQGIAQSQLLILTSAKPFGSKTSVYSQYAWNVSNIPYIGYMVSYPVKVVNGQNITSGFIAILVGEDAQTFQQEDGTSLRLIVSSLNSFGASQHSTSLLTDIYSTFIAKWSGIIESVLIIAVMLAFTSFARTLDSRNKRVFDNTLGLNFKDFTLLSLLVDEGKINSGMELMQKATLYSNDLNWQKIAGFIDRLKWLDIVEERISVLKGEPILVWRFKV